MCFGETKIDLPGVSLSVIDRSGFFALLQDQKLLQNQKQNLLPDSEASVQAEAPVQTGAPVSAESYIMSF